MNTSHLFHSDYPAVLTPLCYRYNFEPRQLLARCLDVVLRIVQQDHNADFVHCLAMCPHYSSATLHRVLELLQQGRLPLAGADKQLQQVMQQASDNQGWLVLNMW